MSPYCADFLCQARKQLSFPRLVCAAISMARIKVHPQEYTLTTCKRFKKPSKGLFLTQTPLYLYFPLKSGEILLLLPQAHAHIGLIPAWVNLPMFHRHAHGAARLVGMGAVVKLAVLNQWAQFREVTIQFVRLDIP
jgi:hypothetical protein